MSNNNLGNMTVTWKILPNSIGKLSSFFKNNTEEEKQDYRIKNYEDQIMRITTTIDGKERTEEITVLESSRFKNPSYIKINEN